MAKGSTERDDRQGSPDGASTCQPKACFGLAHFKYYIHDSITNCRLQLIGDLTGKEVPELSGCWRTAKTTLAERTLYLDLRGLRSLDEAGKEWIIGMAAEGAACIPETFLRDRLAGERVTPDANAVAKNGILARLVSLFRGTPVPSAE